MKKNQTATSKFKHKKPIIAILLIITILLTSAFAFLSATDSKTNVFTIGNVSAQLWEDFDTDNDGIAETYNADVKRINFQDGLLPGQIVKKAPYVINDGNNDEYLFISVGIPVDTLENLYTGNGSYSNDKDIEIKIQAFAIQTGYNNSSTINETYSQYFNEAKLASLFGKETTTPEAYEELFKIYHNDSGEKILGPNSDWVAITTRYTDKYNYTIYKYVANDSKVLPKSETSTKVFDYVKFKENIGENLPEGEPEIHFDNIPYISSFDGRTQAYITPVVQSTGETGIYSSILDAAGVYAKKYFNASNAAVNFNESNLSDVIGPEESTNLQTASQESIKCILNNNYIITSVEDLTGRGDRYLKEKIYENGAIVATIPVPAENGLTNQVYFNSEENSFAYTTPNSSDKYHTISIVGWSDDYDRAKFNKDESGKSLGKKNGAWICKNNDGTVFGDNGYFYMSYTTPIMYATTFEVSQFNDNNMTIKPNSILNNIDFVYGVNVKTYSNSTEKLTIKIDDAIVFNDNITLKNGCNLILFEQPVLSSNNINITSDSSTEFDTFYCYTSPLSTNKIRTKAAFIDTNWLEEVQDIWISVDDNEYCSSTVQSIDHIVRKNGIDNCCYIIPADGYRFTEDTVIVGIDGFDDYDLYEIYGDDYVEFESFSTIEEAVNADYKRLKDGDGNFIKMIEFDPTYDGGRGMLKIVSQNIG